MQTGTSPLHRNAWKLTHCNSIANITLSSNAAILLNSLLQDSFHEASLLLAALSLKWISHCTVNLFNRSTTNFQNYFLVFVSFASTRIQVRHVGQALLWRQPDRLLSQAQWECHLSCIMATKSHNSVWTSQRQLHIPELLLWYKAAALSCSHYSSRLNVKWLWMYLSTVSKNLLTPTMLFSP